MGVTGSLALHGREGPHPQENIEDAGACVSLGRVMEILKWDTYVSRVVSPCFVKFFSSRPLLTTPEGLWVWYYPGQVAKKLFLPHFFLSGWIPALDYISRYVFSLEQNQELDHRRDWDQEKLC
jgi:hypothetical protein